MYENEDLCDAGLVPFFTGPNGWLYCIRNTYLDDAEKKILVIADGDHSVRSVEEDGSIFSAGIVPMSMAEMIIRFADHAELQMKDPHGTSDGLDDETPPESLIEWP